MIITDRMVFIHLHRSGGRFIRSLLLQHLPDAREIGYHFPVTLIPQCYRDRPVIGFVRNPWDWYRSWYDFNRARPRSALFRIASSGGTLGFNETVFNLLHLGSDDPYIRRLKMQLVDALPRSILGNRGAGITQDDLANFNDEHTGYYSWLVQHMYASLLDSNQLQLGRFENFRQELRRLLQACGYRHGLLLQAVDAARAINVTSGAPHTNESDRAIHDGIAQQEGWVCDRFKYPAIRAAARIAQE